MNEIDVIAAFDTVEKLTGAAGALDTADFAVTEVHAPFPAESLPGEAAKPPSRIPAACLAGGAAGAVLGALLQAYISAVSWPMNVGGKPVLSWLAFVPVTFEVMILGAVIGAFWAFLAGVRPSPRSSLQALDQAISRGQCVIRLRARDAGEAGRVADLLRGHGARHVLEARAHPPARRQKRGRDRDWRRLNVRLAVASSACVLVAAVIWTDPTQPNYVFAPAMANSPAAMSYSGEALRASSERLRARPEGTVPKGPLPLRYGASEEDALRAAVELLMPPDIVAEVDTAPGETLFTQLCRTCHGDEGHGDGVTMKRGFQPPASLLTQKARDMEDGQMFHVLTHGQNLMPSHAGQLSTDDRWRVIRYVRSLQEHLPVDPPPFEPATTESEVVK